MYIAKRNIVRHKQPNGFTILEVTVVIVVIAILASITVVSYNAVQQNAKKQNVTADARGVATALNKYRSENGAYPNSLDNLNWSPKHDSTFEYSYSSETDSYCLTAFLGVIAMHITNASSTPVDGPCDGHTTPDPEGAPADPVNIALNPNFEVDMTGVSLIHDNGYSYAWLDNEGPIQGSQYLHIAVSPYDPTEQGAKIHIGPANPSTQYTCTVMVREDYNRPMVMYMGATDAGGNPILSWESPSTQFYLGYGDWELQTLTFTTPATIKDLWMYIQYEGNYHGNIDIDAIMCVRGSTPVEYAD